MKNNRKHIIEIYDDLFNQNLLKDLNAYTENLSWDFGAKYTDDNPLSLQFWGCPIMTNSDLFIENPINIPNKISKCDNIVKNIWNIINNQRIPNSLNLEVGTILVNGQSYGQEGDIHKDHGSEHKNAEEGNYTCIIYLNPIWHPSWQGETMLYNPEGTDIIKAIIPKPGRILFFDSRIPHQARPPHRLIDKLRMTMAFHLTSR